MKPKALLTALTLCLLTVPLAARQTPPGEKLLREHGIALSPRALADFLERGFPSGTSPEARPARPRDKSLLLPEAWDALARQRLDIRNHQPMLMLRLSELAARYARGDLPPGPEAILDRELLGYEPWQRQQARERRLALLRYNGMVALGIFGVANPENRILARELHEAAEDPLLRLLHARTRGLLGDTEVLEEIVAACASPDRLVASQAAQALYVLTGQAFRLHENMARAPRAEAADEIRAWWQRNREALEPIEHESAVARLLEPEPSRPYPLATLRQQLRASADTEDVADARGSRRAWRLLADRDPETLADELEPILRDEREDLDIRAEALRWYHRIRGDKARRQLRRLSKDPNPEIAELAREILGEEQ